MFLLLISFLCQDIVICIFKQKLYRFFQVCMEIYRKIQENSTFPRQTPHNFTSSHAWHPTIAENVQNEILFSEKSAQAFGLRQFLVFHIFSQGRGLLPPTPPIKNRVNATDHATITNLCTHGNFEIHANLEKNRRQRKTVQSSFAFNLAKPQLDIQQSSYSWRSCNCIESPGRVTHLHPPFSRRNPLRLLSLGLSEGYNLHLCTYIQRIQAEVDALRDNTALIQSRGDMVRIINLCTENDGRHVEGRQQELTIHGQYQDSVSSGLGYC